MRYGLLLADADGTLFDFHTGERVAFTATMEAFGLPATEETAALYSRVNQSHWKKLERGETTQARLRLERFVDFLSDLKALNADTCGAPPEAPAEGYMTELAKALAERFVTELGRQHVPMPGAEAFLTQVAAQMPVYLVTNGIAKVQRSRFETSELRPYLRDLLISEELGHVKPDPFMLLEGMRRAGITDKRRVLMLGDSVAADIGAAVNAGVDSILITNGGPAPENGGATYVVSTLAQAATIALAG